MNLNYKKISVKNSLICTSIGLGIIILLNILFTTILLVVYFPIPIIIGLLALFSCTYFYGSIAGKIAFKFGTEIYKLRIIGIFLAWFCVITMGLCGSSYYFFKEGIKYNNIINSFNKAFESYLFKPMFAVIFFGFIPSTILGLYWAKRMKKDLEGLI